MQYPDTTETMQHQWNIAKPIKNYEARSLSMQMQQILSNRGIIDNFNFINPDLIELPNPNHEFSQLHNAVDILSKAITNNQKIAICGDYDADGMTSTALLLSALRKIGADINYAIPSRMHEGYGLNTRIVEEFATEEVKLIITVDNGIAAVDPIARAKELGLCVIITDHHDLPEILPNADAILNPKMVAPTSPYAVLAGVGIAYILAIETATKLGKTKGIAKEAITLMTLGTIADMASLTGANRKWVKRGLDLISSGNVRNLGINALLTANKLKRVTPSDIGYKIAPVINAIGRIGNPQTIIDLFTTTDPDKAKELAKESMATNKMRQALCSQIEIEAIALAESMVEKGRVLFLIGDNWHHGVIGIVASRLVERYGLPVFIAAKEGDGSIRGSARGVPGFNIFDALNYCSTTLNRFGGHPMAGGFSLSGYDAIGFGELLNEFANKQSHSILPVINIDAELNFSQLEAIFKEQERVLHPTGIGNPDPIYWSRGVKIRDQKLMGEKKNHLSLELLQDIGEDDQWAARAMAWGWGEYYPLPEKMDIAYNLNENFFAGRHSLQLQLVSFREAMQ